MNLAASMTRLLSERLGLSAELLGFVVVERALNIVIGNPGPEDRAQTIAHLLQGEGEAWGTLVDEVVVPETWFFRDRKPFQLLASYVTERWLPSNPTGPFKVLCIPCASGEEPYSVAMTVLDAGLEADRIRIDAGDVSERAVAQARQAVYGRSSFREKSGCRGEKYFLPCSEGWRVHEDVTALVRFEKANLLDLSLYRQRAPYNAVFCRNALIYFEQPARRTVIASLRDLLDEDGLLFTGHSELMAFLEAGYQQADHPQSFACRKGAPRRESIFEHGQIATEAAATIQQARKPRRSAPGHARKPPSVSQAAALPPGIEEARQLADRGEVGAATAICERLLSEGSQDPDVYFLLGVISESGGKLEAGEELFRKALFLDPHHYQSLVHMSLLCKRHGDINSSRLYRSRAGRTFSQQERHRAA
jgi:chemotaxis protein methyltransferase WspC